MGAVAHRPRHRLLAGVLGVGASLFVFGFVLFTTAATRDEPTDPPTADAIVVLTGGAHRIEEGARLLLKGLGQRLLISGVNRRNSKDDVFRLTGLDARLFDYCVDLGYAALDTVGNADEAMQWSSQRGYKSLIIVTASYHMPRSLAEMARTLPNTRLIPYPVMPKSWRASPWYLSPSAARVLVAEYLKFLPAAARYLVDRAF